MKCPKCGGEMSEGVALVNTVSGIPDFEGDSGPVTLSYSPDARMVSVDKCGGCGWSVSKGSAGHREDTQAIQ